MQSINTKNNKIYWYLIIFLALCIVILFTRTQINELQILKDEQIQNESALEEARSEVERLNGIEARLNSSEVDISNYLSEFKEDEIIDYIFWQIERDNMSSSDWIVLVRNISMTEWIVNELWFYESNVMLSLRVPNEDRMFRMLDFFVREDSKYKFFIESFSSPANASEWNFNVSIPLKIFYK